MIFNRQLESFMVVAECGSLLQASHKLYITPPALAQQMNLLEESLGFKLFNRSHQGMELTSSGEILYSELKPIFRLLQSAIIQAEAASRREENKLQIGYHLEDDIGCLETVCNRFLSEYPNTQISFKGMSYDSLPDAVKSETIDLAIMFCKDRIQDMGLAFSPFMKIYSVIWVPPHHPLAHRKTLQIEDLRGEQVSFPKLNDLEDADRFRKHLQENEPEISIVELEYDSSITLKSSIENCLVYLSMPFGKKIYPMVPIKLEKEEQAEAVFVYHSPPTKEAQIFMELAEETFYKSPISL